jgi:hypothetical protein
MKISSILFWGLILAPIGKFCEFLGAKNVFLLFEIVCFIGVLYCLAIAGIFLMELGKPRDSIPHNNVNDEKIIDNQNATASDGYSEKENHFSAEIKNREFYTSDVVPKNDRILKVNYSALLMYPLHTRMWRLGITNYAEMYRKYPKYITAQEYKDLELYRLDSDEFQEESIERDSFDGCDTITEDNFLDHSIEERMELLNVDTYTQLCKEYPEFVTYDEFQDLLDNDMIRSVDNIIEFKGMFFHNENSEDTEWRRFKRLRNNYNERYGDESFNQDIDEFPHDYYQEQLSDLEDMEYYGSDMSPEEISDAYNDVLDEYASELEEYNNRKNNY